MRRQTCEQSARELGRTGECVSSSTQILRSTAAVRHDAATPASDTPMRGVLGMTWVDDAAAMRLAATSQGIQVLQPRTVGVNRL
jgi:hypothetical protein